MQQILNVITEATSQDLVTLEEMKMKLGIPDTNTTHDALLSELIENISDTIARMCNRTFAREQVEETFYQLNDGCSQRLYLSRWPLTLSDISSIGQSNGSGSVVDILPDNILNSPDGTWVLEEKTGTLYRRQDAGYWQGTVDVVYTGGYDLPDGAPPTLKFCVESLIREGYMSWIRDPSTFGVRLISHKESRIGYYGPNMFPTFGLPETWKGVNALLYKFIRHWV